MKALVKAKPFDPLGNATHTALSFDVLANMCHGGKIALLGILPPNTPIDWDFVFIYANNRDVIFRYAVIFIWRLRANLCLMYTQKF